MGNQQPNQTKEVLLENIRKDYLSGKTIKQISVEYNIPWSTMQGYITKLGINIPNKLVYRLANECELKDKLVEEYHINNLTMCEIAKKHGFSTRNKVKFAMDYYGIPTTKITTSSLLTYDTLYTLYIQDDLSQYNIADMYNISASLVNKRLKKFGITKDRVGDSFTDIGKVVLKDRDKLLEYLKKNKTTVNKLAKVCGCSVGTVYSKFHEYGIDWRRYIEYNLSHMETEVLKILMTAFPWLKRADILIQDRALIQPYELDFYIPSMNLAIEVNDYHTHAFDRTKTSKYRSYDKDRHKHKTALCESKQVKLLHIWPHDLERLKELLICEEIPEAHIFDADKYSYNELSKIFDIKHKEQYLVVDFNGEYQYVDNPPDDGYKYLIKTSGVWEVQRL